MSWLIFATNAACFRVYVFMLYSAGLSRSTTSCCGGPLVTEGSQLDLAVFYSKVQTMNQTAITTSHLVAALWRWLKPFAVMYLFVLHCLLAHK